MTFDRAENGDVAFTAILTVRRHWRLFAAVTLLFILYALWILLSPWDLAKAEARIKVHEDHIMLAIDMARARGVVPQERKTDKTISLVAVASKPSIARAQLDEAITAIEIEIRKPGRNGLEVIESQAARIDQGVQLLRLQIVEATAVDTSAWNDGSARRREIVGAALIQMYKLTSSVEKLTATIARLGSRANASVHLVQEPYIASRSDKPRALAQAGAAWIFVCFGIGLAIHGWCRVREAWRMAGKI